VIIKEIEKLRIISNSITNKDEIDNISYLLKKELNNHKNGVGLSAPQIGIYKKICLIKIGKNEIILINPEIIEYYGETFYTEGCLSFPNENILTKRYSEITVKTINELLYFSIDNNELECIAVQHEIDHLNGILMFDRKYIQNPIININKIKPNTLVKIYNENTKKELYLKYKKCQPLLQEGWILRE